MTQTGQAQCHGNGATHCCYINGSVCPYLEEDTQSGRYWSCGLKNELGLWLLVHLDLRYIVNVRGVWDTATGILGLVDDCGDWKIDGQCCYGSGNPPVHNQ